MNLRIIVPSVLALALATGAAFAQGNPAKVDAVLQKARAYGYQVRTGRYDLAAEALAVMEEATKAEPGNSDRWTALGTANFYNVTASANPGGKFADLPVFAQKGSDAYDKAIALNPNDAVAYAGRGTARAILAQFTRNPALLQGSVDDLNKALALRPDLPVVHLQRAFSGVNLPAPMRDKVAPEQDLKFLIAMAPTRRETDRLHMMLGDLYFETGRLDAAKTEYDIAASAGTTAQAAAALRTTALAKGELPSGEIASLRAKTGQDCASCHGQ